MSKEVCHQPHNTHTHPQSHVTDLPDLPDTPSPQCRWVLRFAQTKAMAVTTWSRAVGQGQLADSLSPTLSASMNGWVARAWQSSLEPIWKEGSSPLS